MKINENIPITPFIVVGAALVISVVVFGLIYQFVLREPLPPLSTLSPELITSTSIPAKTPVANMELVNPTLAQGIPLLPIAEGSPKLITNGERSLYQVALTFDACQTEDNPSGYDTEIVRVLNETQTPATLFLGGLWMETHLAQTQELAHNPLFEIGNHSWSHPDFTTLNISQMRDEIQQTQEKMWQITGRQGSLFRFPYGTYTDVALKVVADLGMFAIQWEVVSGDPDENVTAERMTDWVVNQVQPGSIIIMHINGRGWHTAEALPNIIETLKGEGYTFVTVSKLLGIEKK